MSGPGHWWMAAVDEWPGPLVDGCCGRVARATGGWLLWTSGPGHWWMGCCGRVVQATGGWAAVDEWPGPLVDGLLWTRSPQ